jgi:hypothetical protein
MRNSSLDSSWPKSLRSRPCKGQKGGSQQPPRTGESAANKPGRSRAPTGLDVAATDNRSGVTLTECGGHGSHGGPAAWRRWSSRCAANSRERSLALFANGVHPVAVQTIARPELVAAESCQP